MGWMNEREHSSEGRLIVNVRRIIVVWKRVREEMSPPPHVTELNKWMRDLAEALNDYEAMMEERDDGRA